MGEVYRAEDTELQRHVALNVDAVVEETQHTLIVGDDATRFAVGMGFEETSLTNAASQQA